MTWPQSDTDHVMVTSRQMSIIEQNLFDSGLPVASLMEKVGLAMSNWLIKKTDLIKDGVLILVGPGHNGGDGLVIARELHLAGVKVSIWCPFEIKKNLTIQHFSHVRWLGVEVIKNVLDFNEDCLWIDALFGLGQSKPLPKFIEEIYKEKEKIKKIKLISIDIPSGICSDSGIAINGFAFKACFTLTAALIKKGLTQDISVPYVGEMVRIDIGIENSSLRKFNKDFPLAISSNDLSTFPWPKINQQAMKYQRGRLLVIAGSDRYRGAALLSLRGALASGVGCIYAVLPKAVAEHLWQSAPEIIVNGSFDENSLKEGSPEEQLQEVEFKNLDVVLIGPGLGKLEFSFISCLETFQRFSGLLVLDADAINQLASSREGWTWLKGRNGPTWLTPHSKEFERLFPELRDMSPLDGAKEAARLSGAGILLKGAHTVIADPKGYVWQVLSSDPWVARAGWGDVLAGYVAGLGALGCASSTDLSHDLLAGAALIHAESALQCKEASAASDVSLSLAKLTRQIQGKECDGIHSAMS